jgi:hypothetical protein
VVPVLPALKLLLVGVDEDVGEEGEEKTAKYGFIFS